MSRQFGQIARYRVAPGAIERTRSKDHGAIDDARNAFGFNGSNGGENVHIDGGETTVGDGAADGTSQGESRVESKW